MSRQETSLSYANGAPRDTRTGVPAGRGGLGHCWSKDNNISRSICPQDGYRLCEEGARNLDKILHAPHAMAIKVFGYVPAWGLPDISPYVTKLIFYMKITKIPFEYVSQDLATLDHDAPCGKLPYIIDTDSNTLVADSNMIIAYLQQKFGDALDSELTNPQRAVAVAFDRLFAEHLYWSGVIEPRWRMDVGWETYIPYIVQGAEVDPELRAALDAFRARILAGFTGQGMGRRESSVVLAFYKADIDAVADFLADKKYFLGDKVHTIDACAYAMLRHLADQPQKWAGSGYLEGKSNIMAYLERMRHEFNI